jgi:hypothetical protein
MLLLLLLRALLLPLLLLVSCNDVVADTKGTRRRRVRRSARRGKETGEDVQLKIAHRSRPRELGRLQGSDP